MNSTQNKKIEQVKETTMIVGIDVGRNVLGSAPNVGNLAST